MTILRIGDDISLELPEGVELSQRSGGRRDRGARRSEADQLDRALLDADLVIAADFELAPAPSAPADGRRRRAEPVAPELTVEAAPDEGVVLLVENSGGVFAWVMPAEDGPAARRSGARTLRFPLAPPADSAGAGDRRGRRGVISWIGDRLIDPIRVRVLRFAAGRAIDFAVDRFEGKRDWGLVDISGPSDS
jgi:hypothetical protein